MAALFPNASYFNVGEITQINQASSQSPEDVALKELHAHISDVAMHTSSARVDAPKCHEDTREAVQKDVLSWTEACVPAEIRRMGDPASTEASGRPEPRSSNPETRPGSSGAEAGNEILWLTGPAGTGKTAIMGTVSERLESAGQLAATFYFSASRGAAGTTLKELFVTTLAYQMVVHPGLQHRLALPMMAAIRGNPAVFKMTLERQLELLILAPLRATQGAPEPILPVPTSIMVDGVDECGESSDRRTREKDQLEVLSILLKAMNDPTFPFRIVVASRPETWIRRYLTEKAVGKVHEIFLDEKYGPDDDIRLYLKSKFSEIARKSGMNPSTWPSEVTIAKLVGNASGQFIYAATVVRWVDTPGTSPQAQLDAVLNLKAPPGAKSHPLGTLDALYTSILKSTPDPETTVLWLKGVHLIQQASHDVSFPPSSWTVDRLLESYQGQAQSVLGGLPSLVHTINGETDLKLWDNVHMPSIPLDVKLLNRDCGAAYAFYHKSFLDYLDDNLRCGAAFPNLNQPNVKVWLGMRVSQTLKCCGPEVALTKALVPIFQQCLLMHVEDLTSEGCIVPDSGMLGDCMPDVWLRMLKPQQRPINVPYSCLRALYILAHINCHQSLPCNRGCKRWRSAISKLPSEQWRNPKDNIPWTREDLRLDRFCIKRLPLVTIRG